MSATKFLRRFRRDHSSKAAASNVPENVEEPKGTAADQPHPMTSSGAAASADRTEREENISDERQTEEYFEDLLKKGEILKCPECGVYIEKTNKNSDWVRCSLCKTEICWATKGRRWGPGGKGDTSGGCRCRVNNQKCAPHCRNCH